MAKRRARRHRRGPSVIGITPKRRNNPGMALSPTVLMGIGILVIGGAAAYYFLSKSSSGGGGGGGGGESYGGGGGGESYGGGGGEQPQLPSEETAASQEIVIPANVTPVATPANTPTGAQPRRVTLGPSTTQPSSTWTPAAQPYTAPITANERSRLARLERTPVDSPARPRFVGVMPTAEYTRYKSLSPEDQRTYYLLLDTAQHAAYDKKRVEVMKADWAAKDVIATANYEREAGAALMPIAVYVIYNNSQAEFDKDINRYRSDFFYHLLYLLVTGNNNTHPNYKLVNRLNGSSEAKAFRLKSAKEMGALWAKSRERATINGVEVFKKLKEGGWNNSFKG